MTTSNITPMRIPKESMRGDGLGCRQCCHCRHPHRHTHDPFWVVRRDRERRKARRTTSKGG